ncbi:MAG: hypothetical protein ACM3TR_19355 [Caulobacteraceae bacterium]
MTNIEQEKELIFVKLIRKGPHVLEFSNDYLMVHNGKITIATSKVLEKYLSVIETADEEKKGIMKKTIAALINEEYYNNKAIEWYSLRDYIDNFNPNRLEELKEKIS